MQSGVEKKYIILFAILIAITGFTFESQTGNIANVQQAPGQSSGQTSSHIPTQYIYQEPRAMTVSRP